MDCLPLEIVNIISLSLKPLTLAINNKYILLYDDNWYNNYLQILYPELNLWKRTTYKDLYIKSLSSVNIKYTNYIHTLNHYKPSLYFHQIPIKCVEAYQSINYIELVLTFNGDLYLDNKLLDTHVVTIHPLSYATDKDWFQINFDGGVTKIASSINVTKILNLGTYICANTTNGIYIYDIVDKNITYLSLDHVKDFHVMHSENTIFILENNGNLRVLDIDKHGSVDLTYKKKINKFHGDGLITENGDYISYRDSTLSCDKLLKICGYSVELTDNKIIVNDDFKLDRTKAKDIYRCEHFLYIKY
jgi:hypothetical protein